MGIIGWRLFKFDSWMSFKLCLVFVNQSGLQFSCFKSHPFKPCCGETNRRNPTVSIQSTSIFLKLTLDKKFMFGLPVDRKSPCKNFQNECLWISRLTTIVMSCAVSRSSEKLKVDTSCQELEIRVLPSSSKVSKQRF